MITLEQYRQLKGIVKVLEFSGAARDLNDYQKAMLDRSKQAIADYEQEMLRQIWEGETDDNTHV